MNPTVIVSLVAGSLLLAGFRSGGITHPVFQALAHVWVGAMLGAWRLTRFAQKIFAKVEPWELEEARILFKSLFWALCVLEVVCFLASKLL